MIDAIGPGLFGLRLVPPLAARTTHGAVCVHFLVQNQALVVVGHGLCSGTFCGHFGDGCADDSNGPSGVPEVVDLIAGLDTIFFSSRVIRGDEGIE